MSAIGSLSVRIILGVLGLAVAAGVWAGTANAQEPIKILAIDSRSGPFKDNGIDYQSGVEYAVEEINRRGGINGRPIKLFLADSELDPGVTRRKSLEYILEEDVKVIIGMNGSNLINAMIPLADEHKVILVLYGGEDDAITGKNFRPAVFRVSLNTSMHAAATVEALRDRPFKKVFLLNQDYAFGHSMAAAYKKALDRVRPGWELVGEEYHPIATTDFAPYLVKVRASGAEVLLSGNWGPDLSNLLTQMDNFGIDIPTGQIFLGDTDILREVRGAAVGSVTSHFYMVGIDTPQNKEFVKRWQKDHAGTGNPLPDFETGKAYVATMFLAKALEKAEAIEYQAIIDAWEGMEYESLVGTLKMRACDHQVQMPIAAATIVEQNAFYDFPYLGPITIVPADVVSVPPKETGNVRCMGGANGGS